MTRIVAMGEPANDIERVVIAHLRDNAPDAWTVIHNFELPDQGHWYEIDLAVLTPHAVYLVDVKGTHGLIEVQGGRWYPEHRGPYASPLRKLGNHAKVLKSQLTGANPNRPELQRVYVREAIILGVPDAHLIDPAGKDEPRTTSLARCVSFLGDPSRVPKNFDTDIADAHDIIQTTIAGHIRPSRGRPRFGNWEVIERLSTDEDVTECRARNVYAGQGALPALLRIYRTDPYLPEQQRRAEQRRISTAFRALSRLPPHRCVIGAHDFIGTEDEDRFVLVLHDVDGQALRLHLTRPGRVLSHDQKLGIARDLLAGLAHAQAYLVIHRALSPDVVLVRPDGHAVLTGFDYARTGRSVGALPDDSDPAAAYRAPECLTNPERANDRSDVFSAGVLLWELFAGERPYADAAELGRLGPGLADLATGSALGLPDDLAAWIGSLCAYRLEERPTAAEAARRLAEITATSRRRVDPPSPGPQWVGLPSGYQLTRKYQILGQLGRPGGFGVAYRVFDSLTNSERVVKLILRDRRSLVDRLQHEYQALHGLADHPHVVRVIDADFVPGDNGPPYLVFEFVDGTDVGELAGRGAFTPADVLRLARETAAGLAHLHEHGVFHCDIKPNNIVWSSAGAKIIDFNVSVRADQALTHGGGHDRYVPPDLDLTADPSRAELADRDIYALGITLYECLTDRYPWGDAAAPPPDRPARDPRELTDLDDLHPRFAETLVRIIAPRRGDRYPSARALLADLEAAPAARIDRRPTLPDLAAHEPGQDPKLAPGRPNTNPFVFYLRTLYSQSRRSNRGTRGLDEAAVSMYVGTSLDTQLLPAVLAGRFRLVVITGNAGDGKTAFLQRLRDEAIRRGAEVDDRAAGCRFTVDGRAYLTNYDGSQDDGDRANDEVLDEFFAPYAGEDEAGWAEGECRLIAINEGRLIDYLDGRQQRLPLLAEVIRRGLATGAPDRGVAVVNLNLRSVVAVPESAPDDEESILHRMLRRMTDDRFWDACRSCDLYDKCYVAHNARTFADPIGGARVRERLHALYTLTHLRGRLHITIRDARSALAYLLTSDRDCDEIHDLYAAGRADEIARGFYFNAWMAAGHETDDRLLRLLREIDVGAGSDPDLDRRIDFTGPGDDHALMAFEQRAGYDREVLGRIFVDLTRDAAELTAADRAAHRDYVAMVRRLSYFEGRDPRLWRSMLPYRSAERMLALIHHPERAGSELASVVAALNRGEGLPDAAAIGSALALQVRTVDRGTIRSYRLFPRQRLRLEVADTAARAAFVEHMPDRLALRHLGDGDPVLRIDLDLFEMLHRALYGYRPTVAEARGQARNLAVFKNVLGAAPYDEVLLTVTGRDLYRIAREPDGVLRMSPLTETGSG